MESDTCAVSEIIGAVLLLAITIGIFSVVYVSVLSAPVEEVHITPVIMGEIIQTNVILEHQGGVSLLFTDISIDLDSGAQSYSKRIIEDHNNNGYWEIGDRVIYEFDTFENETISVTIIDTSLNRILLTGILREGYPVVLETYVEPLSSYEYTTEPVNVTAVNLTPVDSINLWYQYSENNLSWGSWTDYSNLTNGTGGWDWEFPFPDHYGYYRFYSIGHYEGQSETPPTQAEASCYYNPPFSINTFVNPINPYIQEDNPININATGDRRLQNVTLYYRFSTDNTTWDVTPVETYDSIGEIRMIPNVGSTWTRIHFWNTYTSAVVVCINNLVSKNDPEACVRMSNVTTSYCDIKLQNPRNKHTVVAENVYVLVMEEGIHNLTDGRHLEAWKFLCSSYPDYKGVNYVGVNRGYSRSYSNPRVFAQIMSYNDSQWSVPLLTNGKVSNPPSSSSLYINRQVGEDTSTARLPETIGYIVIESGSGTNNNMSYSVQRTSDYIDGVDNDGRQVTLGGTYSTGIASLVGLDGGDGGWAVLMGSTPISTYIWLAIDEDTIRDTERKHTSEQVDYWVFSAEGNITSNTTHTTGQWMRKWNSTTNPATTYPWSWEFNLPNGTGFYEFYSIGANTTTEETPPSQADAQCFYMDSGELNNRQAQWHFNEDYGSIASDAVGYMNGNIIGASWTTGVYESALLFNGIDETVDIQNDSSYHVNNTFSFEAWVYLTEQKTSKILQNGDWDGHGLGQDIWNGWNGRVYIDGDGGYAVYWGDGQPDLNTWYHLVVTYDGSMLRLYVNGEEKDNESVTGTPKDNHRGIFIASDNNNQKFFHGRIDEPTIYTRTLNSAEVLMRYEEYRP